MRYWDSSALVVLHLRQRYSDEVRALYLADPRVLTWLLSDVEVVSAIERLNREGLLAARAREDALTRVAAFWDSLHLVTLVEPVRARAKRLLAVHGLRAADAIQLGAALVGVADRPSGREFVCLDDRLAEAARREGFRVVP